MRRNILLGISFTLLSLTIQGCFPAIRPFVYDGAHKGRVVDADTGEPTQESRFRVWWFSGCGRLCLVARGELGASSTMPGKR
jgi:hypothetical protein